MFAVLSHIWLLSLYSANFALFATFGLMLFPMFVMFNMVALCGNARFAVVGNIQLYTCDICSVQWYVLHLHHYSRKYSGLPRSDNMYLSLSLSLSLYIYIYIFVLYSVMIIYIYIYTGIYLYLLLCYIYIYIYSAIGGYIRLCLLYSAMLTFTCVCVCVCVCYFLSILLRHMIFACLPSSTIFATFVEFGHIRECSSIFYVFGKFFFHEVHLYFLMYSAYLPTYVHYV